MQYKKRYSLCIYLLLCSIFAFAQHEGSIIERTKGSRVDFNFHSIRELEEGYTYTDKIELTITFCDETYISNGWELILRTEEPEFFAYRNSVPTIPLDAILITSRLDDGTLFLDEEPLIMDHLVVASGNKPIVPNKCTSEKIVLSFTCISLLNQGYKSDTYKANMDFELRSK